MSAHYQITVGYWAIKGLAAPLRMMVMYSGYRLKAENYDLMIDENGEWSRDKWFDVKDAFKDKNPLINLPYVIDGDILITQSNACLAYLGRKFDMFGDSPLEHSYCEQLLCECMDIRNSVVSFSYGRSGIDAIVWISNIFAHGASLYKLNLWLNRKISKENCDATFFVGNRPSAPDFHIWEMCDQIKNIITFYNLADAFEQYPHLAEFHNKFKELPNNSRYLQSKLHTLPTNNTMAAAFGATPSGDAFITGSERPWLGSSGHY